MDINTPQSPPPAFSPQALMGLYLQGKHDALSKAFLSLLRHFRATSYHTLDVRGRMFVNEFVKVFLHLLTQADYVPGPDHLAEFVRLNLTVSNLVAMSAFGTTDAYLDLVGDAPGKRMTLHSARNAGGPPRRAFFDSDPALASTWYGAYAEAYRSGLVSARVMDNLRRHFREADERLDARYTTLDSYFASTYAGDGSDRVVKGVINRSVRRLAAANGWTVRNRPAPGRVAVVSGNWSPAHSAYRICSAFVDSLAGYHRTLVALGKRRDFDARGFDEVVRVEHAPDGTLDLGPLLDNTFSAVYFPDVGLTPLSILLANLRLAPVQIASLGHSVSTFGAEVDYFVSGALVEPPDDPARNYSERLVLLPGAGAVQNAPDYAPTGRRKSVPEFVLNAPWNAQKINSRLAAAVREIVRRASKTVVLRLFVSGSLDRQNDYLPFVREFQAAAAGGPVEVMRALPYQEYMTLIEEGDLNLDSFPFGGCNTVADGLFLRKLTVTLEGDAWYGRVGPWMVRSAGLPELVTTTEAEYVDTVVRLIDDDAYRAGLQGRLDAADLDATVFRRDEARDFREAFDFLLANHDRLKAEGGRAPVVVCP